MSNKKGYDVYWTLPHQKKPFTSSTIATDNLIISLSEDNMTVRDVYNSINYDEDAKEVLRGFIDSGYENFIMKDFVTQNENRIYRKKEGNEIISVPSYDLKKVITKELKKRELDNIDLEPER